MAVHLDREHFIPLRKKDLIDLLCGDPELPAEDRDLFRQFCKVVSATFHHEYHDCLERLKDAYAPFDPDADTKATELHSTQRTPERLDALFAEFIWLMERANFKQLSKEDFAAALDEASHWGINMEVNFDIFDRLEVFARGDTFGKRRRRPFFRFWRIEEVSVPIYQRLVLILKMRPHKNLAKAVDTRHVYVKFFKDIPKVDLEMLFPGTRLKMPKFERGKLGASILSTLAIIGYKLGTGLGQIAWEGMKGMKNPFAMWGVLTLVAGYGYRQYYGFQKTKQSYSLRLTESLYFLNLDSNAGVFSRLLDEAEEQECREALLAYYFLWRKAGEDGWTEAELDDHVEHYLEQQAQIKIDFEVGDALAKLERMQIVEKTGDRYRAWPIQQALEKLDWTWDNIFKFSNASGADPQSPYLASATPAQ